MTTKDKKIELMVLTSTSHVAPHIAGCISSVVIYLTQVELQMVLISTVSTFFLSFFVSLSTGATSTTRWRRCSR
jgi:hypothetical protein